MKRFLAIALLTLGCLALLSADSPEEKWQQSFDRSFSLTLESREAPVSAVITERYRRLTAGRITAAGDPAAAGEASALLLLRYERDIRSGVDLQAAGARLVQALRLMNRLTQPEKAQRRLELLRRGSAGGSPGSGFSGRLGDDQRRYLRGIDRGND